MSKVAAKDSAADSGLKAPGPSTLTLDTVDYDDTGKLSLSGSAPPKSRVQVYLDNKVLGIGTTGGKGAEKGKWRIAPDKRVASGLYDLRVDQVDEAGKVIARIRTRFRRAAPLSGLPRDSVIFVQPGNSLWRIARRTYGHGVQYTVIYEANRAQIGDPSLIYPGQVFVLPRVN
jgi:nucleoid-associated protein YgaU